MNSSPGLLSVGASSLSAGELEPAVRTLRPDVLLLAVEPPRDNEAVSGWLEEAGLAVVLLSDHPTAAWISAVMRGGAHALLPATATVDEIAAAIGAAAAGLVVLHPEVATAFPTATARPAADDGIAPTPLSAREIEVLRMLAQGLSNKSIAERLQLSEHTVKFHVNSIFNKLDVSTRTEAVTTGARLGLILL